MNAFQEFILEFGPQRFASSAFIQLLINSLVMWFVVNRLLDVGEKNIVQEVYLLYVSIVSRLRRGDSSARHSRSFYVRAFHYRRVCRFDRGH